MYVDAFSSSFYLFAWLILFVGALLWTLREKGTSGDVYKRQSVDYGPLTLSLKIDEKYIEKDSRETAIGDSKWQKGADPKKWPTTEIYANSPWNYSLVLDKNCLLYTSRCV